MTNRSPRSLAKKMAAMEDGRESAQGLQIQAGLEKAMKTEQMDPSGSELGQSSSSAILGHSSQHGGKTLAHFLPSLREEAQKTNCDNAQTAEDKESCGDVEEEIPEAEIPEVQRQRFRQFRYQEAEGPRRTCHQLWELCHQWLVPEKHTKEQILELVILEQFLAILPHRIRHRVQEGGPETCSQAVALAESFLLGLPEEQTPEPFREEGNNFLNAEMGSPDAFKRTSASSIKQENEGDATSFGGDKRLRRTKASQPENPGERKTYGILPAEAVSGPADQSEAASDNRKGNSSGKKWDRLDKSGLPENKNTRSAERRYQCSFCEKSFKHRSTLTVHQRTHTGERPYTCSHCEKSFMHRSNLIVHERTHTGEKPYKCLDCGKSFCHRSNLIAHETVHAAGAMYQCVECGERFEHLSHLNAHKPVHLEEKPHECSDCGKSFNQRSALTDHKRTHREEKPHKCSQCGKTFSKRSALIVHERTHKEEKPYHCSDCGESFSERSVLVAHERIHVGERLCSQLAPYYT
ncbi:zinc finger protein 397-like isoform X2 [Sceloporus undulatus]|uniref:zinc finger protein 397-like isoform X2 n=1 Tax=Sceloporus undulatus TaxID=8520 RepID=UPI001C4A8A98|nr:zinc finger protein 397-like isoform X2 [Sceloporus undulatus]